MKTIGLLGGTSWPSTFIYYETLNRAAQKALGGFHSARILLYSVDYHPIKSQYDGDRSGVPELLKREIEFFMEKKPDCLILCNNSLHKYLDLIGGVATVPVFHAGHLAAEEAQRRDCKKVLLLGTAYTMEDGFFAAYFKQRDIEVITPDAHDRRVIQSIQTELSKGKTDPAYRHTFGVMLKKYADVDAIILACTELPLAIDEENAPKPLINPILCQCDAAAKFAFKDA